MQSQVLGGAIGGHPCDGMPWLAPKPVRDFEDRASVEHVEPPPCARASCPGGVTRCEFGHDAYFFGIDHGVTIDGK